MAVTTRRFRPRYYILLGKQATPASAMEWARWFEKADRRVAHTDFRDGYVSTVFLGLDHNFSGSGPPLLFETMIFGGAHDQWQDRCATWEEAEAMHARAVVMVQPLRLVN